MRHLFSACCLLTLLVPAALAQELPAAPQPPAASKAEAKKDVPSAAPAPPSPELLALLDQIEAKAKTLRTMDSRIRLTRKQGLLGDEQVRFGRFRYAAGVKAVPAPLPAPAVPAKVQIEFDRVVVDGKAEKVDIRYAFDGYWLLETNAKDHAATRREIRAKDDPKDALAIGGGPWPIPMSFEKAAILAQFDVQPGPAGPAEDKREAVRLILTPKPGAKLEVDKMILTFEKGTWEPVGATSLRGDDATEVLLSKPAFNDELPKDTFSTRPPEGADWRVEEVPKR